MGGMNGSTCDHVICIIEGKSAGSCIFVYGMRGIGGRVQTEVPPDRLERAQQLLKTLDRDAIRLEIKRRQMLASIKELAQIAELEMRDTSSASKTEEQTRAAQLLDRLKALSLSDADR